jgi:ankyrin repeat protein
VILTSRINNGRTVLMNAANHGLEVIIELLLKQGADPNVRDKEDGMPLMDAAANGQVAAVDLFLASDEVDRDIKEDGG